MTRDHKADDELEIEAVRQRGGFVARGRVMAMIAIARALGDKSLAEFLGHSPDVFEFAVDEGVLALSGYRTPDPFAQLYAPRGLAVWTCGGTRLVCQQLSSGRRRTRKRSGASSARRRKAS